MTAGGLVSHMSLPMLSACTILARGRRTAACSESQFIDHSQCLLYVSIFMIDHAEELQDL